MKEQKSALLNLLDSLLEQDECEFLDLKQEFHANKIDLIHDILCLANAYTEEDRYLVFGISDDKQIIGLTTIPDKKQADIINLLSNIGLNRIPSTTFNLIEYKEKNLAILTIKNRPTKPFLLTKDYQEPKDGKPRKLSKNAIYTRSGDTNTPKDSTATEEQLELIWRERFGLDSSPLERLDLFLNESKEWIESQYEPQSFYYKKFPEFTIVDAKDDLYNFREIWTDNSQFEDPSISCSIYHCKYHTTVLASLYMLHVDGARYTIPMPIAKAHGDPYFTRDSRTYKFAKIICKDFRDNPFFFEQILRRTSLLIHDNVLLDPNKERALIAMNKIKKGRLTFKQEYRRKGIYIAFEDSGTSYLYPHDEILDQILALGKSIAGTPSWEEKGLYHFPRLSKKHKELLEPYKLT